MPASNIPSYLVVYEYKNLINLTEKTEDPNLNKEIMDKRTGATVEKGSFAFSPIINYRIFPSLKYDTSPWNIFVLYSSYLKSTLTL